MTVQTGEVTVADMGGFGVPLWVDRLVDIDGARWSVDDNNISWRAVASGPFALVSVRVRNAVALDAAAFRAGTIGAYERIAACLGGQAASHPVRLWNFVPKILAPLGDFPHRYMVLNVARYSAYTRWYGSSARFSNEVATASGVGHFGRDLVIHCLGATRPGHAVQNPRQIAPYDYSSRFGPRPPCFARATRVEAEGVGASWLFVGGTASVRGEDTMFAERLDQQMDETLLNLASVVSAGMNSGNGRVNGAVGDTAQLDSFTELRVYYVRAEDRAQIERTIGSHFPGVARVEYVHADLCRPELLVEIEGVAALLTPSVMVTADGSCGAQSVG